MYQILSFWGNDELCLHFKCLNKVHFNLPTLDCNSPLCYHFKQVLMFNLTGSAHYVKYPRNESLCSPLIGRFLDFRHIQNQSRVSALVVANIYCYFSP